MTQSLAIGQLRLGQRVLGENDSAPHSYDLCIVGISWERRASTALGQYRALSTSIWGIRFESADPEIRAKKDNHERTVLEAYGDARILSLKNSLSFTDNIRVIESELSDLVVRLGRPVKVLVDITCIPKSYTLFMLGLGFTKGLFAKLDCVYAEGMYSNADYQDDVQSDGSVSKRIVSEGVWTSIQVSYLESEIVIPKSHDLVVAMGGELGFALPFVERYEPRAVGVVLIKDGLLQNPLHLSGAEREGLTKLLAEPNVDTATVELTDALGVAAYALDRVKRSMSECVTAIAIGAKPHALALGIAALNTPTMEVICRVPKRYKPLDVAPTGKVFIYEIEDRFEPEAYF